MSALVPTGRKHDFEDEQEYFEERAGILEYEAGLPREEAERLARKETLARYFAGDVAVLLATAAADAVHLQDDALHATGPAEARRSWLPTLRRFRPELLSYFARSRPDG
ncbi:MAG: hypothetical protein U1F58_00475 [Burkholderiales bacterium]